MHAQDVLNFPLIEFQPSLLPISTPVRSSFFTMRPLREVTLEELITLCSNCEIIGIAAVFYLFEVAFLANARTRRFEFPAPRSRDSTSVIRNLVFFCVLNR